MSDLPTSHSNVESMEIGSDEDTTLSRRMDDATGASTADATIGLKQAKAKNLQDDADRMKARRAYKNQ